MNPLPHENYLLTLLAEIIALQSNSHVLAESVILPACQKMVKVMLGDKAEQDISKIPFSNSTIQRRIINLSGNIEQSVMAELKNCQFGLQIDESIDISNHAQLIAFVRFIDEGSSGHRLIWWGDATSICNETNASQNHIA